MRHSSLLSRLLLLAVVLAGGYLYLVRQPDRSPITVWERQADSKDDSDLVGEAFRQGMGDIQVRVHGRVEKLLPDDREGRRHQRFLVRLASGQTLLVAHNLELAPRVKGLNVDAGVELYGEYAWNNKGGVIHWTHHDPRGSHPEGWIRYQGRLYQ